MIVYHNEDLLASDCTVIAHQVNCQSKMGAGIALRISKLFPRACLPYFEDKRPVNERLGTCLIGHEPGNKKVAHLYGQLRYGRDKRYTDYDALHNALHSLAEQLQQPFKLGLPLGMGCNNAGGDWNIVLQILEHVSNEHQINIHVYNYGR